MLEYTHAENVSPLPFGNTPSTRCTPLEVSGASSPVRGGEATHAPPRSSSLRMRAYLRPNFSSTYLQYDARDTRSCRQPTFGEKLSREHTRSVYSFTS